ncbi:uncharacterized protein LOC133560190 [Nerophis ophidion]|uniref:uncharacterized protein LOC133560190 n=1 Tax=Nerophis ophidion TaxID=159077 RepID=UPI002ADF1AE8|nr:uncharacterized protein LOC133560190 [Nerophis ophidion]
MNGGQQNCSEMSTEASTHGPADGVLTLEKIQQNIKDFFVQRGLLGEAVRSSQENKNTLLSLKDKERDDKINSIIKSIVEKSSGDIAKLRQLITHWDAEERATSDCNIDTASYGVVTQQKIKKYLKDFFSQRIIYAEREEEDLCSGATSAIGIFARAPAVITKKAQDSDTLDPEEEDDTGIFEEELSAYTDEQYINPDTFDDLQTEETSTFSQTLDGSLSPSEEADLGSPSTSPTTILDQAKHLLLNVINPVVETIDTASKTIVEKMKSTLMSPDENKTSEEEEPCNSEMESICSPSSTRTQSSRASTIMSDSKYERDSDILDQEAEEDTCNYPDFLEGSIEYQQRDAGAADIKLLQSLNFPSGLEEPTHTPCNYLETFSTESIESISKAHNLACTENSRLNEQVAGAVCLPDLLECGSTQDSVSTGYMSPENMDAGWLSSEEGAFNKLNSPEVWQPPSPPSVAIADSKIMSPKGWSTEQPLFDTTVDYVKSLEDWVERRPSSEATVESDFTSENWVTKRPSSEAEEYAKFESSEDRVAKKLSSVAPADSDLYSPEDWVTKRPSETLANADCKSPMDYVPKRSSSVAGVDEICKSPEEWIARRPSESLANADCKSPEDYVPKRSSSVAVVDAVCTSPEDWITRRPSSESGAYADPLSPADQVTKRPSSVAMLDAELKLHEVSTVKRSSTEAGAYVELKSPEDWLTQSPSVAEVEAGRKFSEGCESRRSSSKAVVDTPKLSEGRGFSRSSSKEPEDMDKKVSEDSVGKNILSDTTDLEETPSLELHTRTSLWKRWLIRRPRKIHPLLEDCPGTILDCIGAKPAIRPIFKKVKSMWKTHYGRRKSKRVKTKSDRKGERTPYPIILENKTEEDLSYSFDSSKVSVTLPLSDSSTNEDLSTDEQSSHFVEDAHDMTSFFENMFKKEFSKQLEKSLKRSLFNVVNDSIPEKGSSAHRDKSNVRRSRP